MEEAGNLRQAGKSLAEYANLIADADSRTRSEILFPYIYLASKKLSSRAISRWFAEQKGIDFSAASVAKVLRECDKYFQLIAERVQPLADHIACQFCGDSEVFLFQPSGLDQIEQCINKMHPGEDALSYTARVLNELREEWFDLDEEIRFRCRPFFEFDTATETQDNDEN